MCGDFVVRIAQKTLAARYCKILSFVVLSFSLYFFWYFVGILFNSSPIDNCCADGCLCHTFRNGVKQGVGPGGGYAGGPPQSGPGALQQRVGGMMPPLGGGGPPIALTAGRGALPTKTVKAKAKLSAEEIESRTSTILDEFFNIGDLNEVC